MAAPNWLAVALAGGARLWPPDTRPRLRHTRDVDDWLAVITAGQAVGLPWL